MTPCTLSVSNQNKAKINKSNAQDGIYEVVNKTKQAKFIQNCPTKKQSKTKVNVYKENILSNHIFENFHNF